MKIDLDIPEEKFTSVDSFSSGFEPVPSVVDLQIGSGDETMDNQNSSQERLEFESPSSTSPKQREANEASVVAKESLADWGILACVSISNFLTALEFTGFGVFYPYLVEHFEATTAAVGWCSSITGFFQAVVALFASYPIQSYGCRLPGIVGCLLCTLGLSFSCLAPNLTMIYFTYGVIAGSGSGIFVLSAGIIVHQRFGCNRTLASGISWIGFSVGSTLGPILIDFLIKSYSWRGAFLILGAISAQRIPFCLLFRTPKRFTSQSMRTSRNSPPRLSGEIIRKYLKESFNFTTLLDERYSIYAVAYFLYSFNLLGYLHHTVNRAIHVGLSRDQGVAATSLIGIVSLSFRVPLSFIANLPMVNSSLVFAIGMFFAFLSVVATFLDPGFIGTVTSVMLFGVHLGITVTVFIVVAVDLMGVTLLPKCLAILQFIGGFAKLASPPLIGWIFDKTGDYRYAFAIIGCAAFVSGSLMVVVAFITRHHRKPDEDISTSTDI